MKNINLIFLSILILSLTLINADTNNQKPVICVNECIQDYNEYNTINFFTMISHKDYHLICINGNNLNKFITYNCCIGNPNE